MVVAAAARRAGLFRHTPLIKAQALSQATGRDVYFKLDNLQASGSFKDRGMAHLCYELTTRGGTTTTADDANTTTTKIQKVISSSGGNAGLAVATVAPQLGLEVDVYVPETTKPLVVTKLQSLGAKVTIHGANWNEADTLARQKVEECHGTAAYISPYDHPLLWTGHSTVVDEILQELPNMAALCVSVGGGGLLCGVLEGLQRHNHACHVLAVETEGANCFAAAVAAGHPVRLPAITSIATSLGALETTPATLERQQEYTRRGGRVQSVVVSDAQAVRACDRLATDIRCLVEPACGSALAVAYDDTLFAQYLQNDNNNNNGDDDGPIVVLVCGGSGVSIDLLQQWKQELQL